MHYFKKNVVVSTYPEEFADGSVYPGKACSKMEVVASSFGLFVWWTSCPVEEILKRT